MSFKLEIANGLNSHGDWKLRLIDAINTGKSEWEPHLVCKDNECEFGKWLYSCDESVANSPKYEKVKSLHADFHRAAAEVLRLALSNEKPAALKAISTGSPYLSISAKLTQEMMSWSCSI